MSATDEKITALAAATVLDPTDIVPIVQNMGGTPVTKYVPLSTLASYVSSVPGSITLGDMANLAANSLIGNATGSPATPTAIPMTGSGNVVMSASPTFTGTIVAAAANLSGRVGIGGNSLGSTVQLSVLPPADNVIGVVVKQHSATHTALLFNGQDYTGANIFNVKNDGSVNIVNGTLTVGGTAQVKGHSFLGANISAADTHFVVSISEQITPFDAVDVAAIAATATSTSAYASQATVGGIFEGIHTAGAGNWTIGASGASYLDGAGTTALAMGVQGLVENRSTGTITIAAGVRSQLAAISSGNIGTAYGVYILTPILSSSGVITGNLTGIYVEDMTLGGGSNYTLYGNAGAVSLLGSITRASATSMVGKLIEYRAATLTITGTTHVTTATGVNYFDIAAPTYTDSSAVTVDIGATVAIAGAPIAAGSVTLTTPLALWVQAGDVRLGALTASRAVFTDANKTLVSNAITGTGNVVMSASPTLTGTISAAAATFSGDVTLTTKITFSNTLVAQGLLLFDSGANAHYGAGVQGGEMRIFVPTTAATGFRFGTIATSDGTTFTEVAKITTAGVISGTGLVLSAANIATDTTTGMKIGTAGGSSGQKLGFFNATPIVQPLLATGAAHSVDDVITTLQNLGLARQS